MVARATLLRDQIERQPGDQPCGIDGDMSAGDAGGGYTDLSARARAAIGSSPAWGPARPRWERRRPADGRPGALSGHSSGIHRQSPTHQSPCCVLAGAIRQSGDRLCRSRTTVTAPPGLRPLNRRPPILAWMASRRDRPQTLRTFTTHGRRGRWPALSLGISTSTAQTFSWPPCR